MVWKYLRAGLIVFFFYGCTAEEETPPPIPPEILQEIVAEVLILEPAGRELSYAIQDSVYDHYYQRILSAHGYTQDDFIAAMQWLQNDPKRLGEVYTEVLERIQIIETEANK